MYMKASTALNEECHFGRRWYGSDPEQLRVQSEWLIEQHGRGSGDGIDNAILEAHLRVLG
jgi:hypothetical protein